MTAMDKIRSHYYRDKECTLSPNDLQEIVQWVDDGIKMVEELKADIEIIERRNDDLNDLIERVREAANSIPNPVDGDRIAMFLEIERILG